MLLGLEFGDLPTNRRCTSIYISSYHGEAQALVRTNEGIIRDRDPSEDIPWFVFRSHEACRFVYSRLAYRMHRHPQTLVDRVSGATTWIQHSRLIPFDY